MSPLLFAALLAVLSLGAWLPFMALTLIRNRSRDRMADAMVWAVGGAAGGTARLDVPEPLPKIKKPDVSDVSRRQFLNRGMAIAILAGLGQFALASLDFLYPRLRGGLGAKITVGNADEIRNEISASREPKFIPDGRFYLSIYEGEAADAEKIAAYVAANVPESGFLALYRKCVHLGCSVPWCPPAKWFECPCHGSKYSINGEYRDGPAPRSLDQFKVVIQGGNLVVDTSTIIQGAPRGTRTSQPQPEGAHCVNIREG
jgi:cytochrome b6-f complex iron-sulfur subunit